MDPQMLQDELLALLATIEGRFARYARTYAANIVENVAMAARYGDPVEKGVRTQLNYVFCNLRGCRAEDILKVDALCKDHGFDMPEAVSYALEQDED